MEGEMGRYDEDWPPGRPFDKHRHLCDLCKFGVVMWTSEEECSPVHDDHHEGACAKCRKKLGKKVRRRLAELRAFDAARERAR
jgi:hypothetical protein